ncbi:C-type mannose receptor 2-like [Acipenser ruthenus]|uniref:C-type mannose receptor 2-like n=1 Tax=Acipenser ruthenus TaxID=7906 RepID=UPI0027410E42|nr:C-type mannose receptor 2-like [Acipenser ruthenus]
MGERGLLILLLAGFCVPADNQIRKHVFVKTLKSWSEAQSYCREKHTDLATVRSQEETQQLLNIAGASLITEAWIGLYRDGTQNWQWSNSEDVIYNWTAKLFCASINSVGRWEDRVCFEKNAFMCYNETSTITERYTLIEELKNWTEAQQYCREHHTDLVSIKNTSENEDLVKKAQGKPFWIGLFNEPWKWSHQGDNYTFHYWSNEQPDNWGGNENCVEIMKSGEWNDCGCISQFPFFCYDDPRDTTTVQFDSQSSPTTGPAASQTQDGGEQSQQPSTMDGTSPRASSPSHSSSWLPGTSPAGTGTPVPEDLHLISDSMVWPEAWQYCKDHYTDLVSLTSLAAQNRVSELVRNSTASRFWTGLHRTVVYNNWYWVAGKDKKGLLNYTNWAPGEPNNPYYEHCGEMVLREDGGAEWNDLCCYEKLPFICFKD